MPHSRFKPGTYHTPLTDRLDDVGSSTSETLANFYQTTQRNIPEDSHILPFQYFTVAIFILGYVWQFGRV
jgi:hypothetical protein